MTGSYNFRRDLGVFARTIRLATATKFLEFGEDSMPFLSYFCTVNSADSFLAMRCRCLGHLHRRNSAWDRYACKRHHLT
jgi:hypothetical protein